MDHHDGTRRSTGEHQRVWRLVASPDPYRMERPNGDMKHPRTTTDDCPAVGAQDACASAAAGASGRRCHAGIGLAEQRDDAARAGVAVPATRCRPDAQVRLPGAPDAGTPAGPDGAGGSPSASRGGSATVAESSIDPDRALGRPARGSGVPMTGRPGSALPSAEITRVLRSQDSTTRPGRRRDGPRRVTRSAARFRDATTGRTHDTAAITRALRWSS